MARARADYEFRAQDRTSPAFRSIRRSLGEVGGALLSFKGAIAGAIGVGGLAAMVKASIDAGDQIQKLSLRLGASTEALSELRHVAELSGVSFNTLTMGLQRMTRRVSEAAQGTGEAKNALAELRIDAEKLNRLRPEQQFEALADAINGLSSESDKVRIAMKLFDSEGVALLQTMQEGAAGIREARDEARELGLTFSKDQAEGAARAKDAIARLSGAIGGLGKTLAVELGPALTSVTGWMGTFVQAVRYAGEEIGILERSIGSLSLGQTMLEMESIGQQIAEIRKDAELTGGIGPSDQSRIDSLIKRLGALSERYRRLHKEQQDLAYGRQNLVDVTAKATVEEEKLTKATGMSIEAIRAEAEWQADTARQTAEAVKNANQQQYELALATKKTNSVARDLGFTFQSAFEDAIIGGEGLRDVFKGLLQDITRVILRTAITAPIGNAIGSAIGSISFGGARAGGGPVSAGSAYLVGESGPELFFPGRSGMIAAGGGPQVIIEDHRGLDAPPIEMARAPGPNGQQILRAVIRSENRRALNDGSLDRTMRGNFGARRTGILR